MFRWGILSTAKIGREQLIPAIHAAKNNTVHAVASRNRKRARDFAGHFSIPHFFGSYEELLACDEIDGIYIPLPTSQHVEWSLKAAQAGKHVLCEKPIALQASEIKDLQKVAKKHKVLISEAFMVTHHPQWHKVKELIEEGAIGNLKHVQGAFSYFNDDPKNMRNIASLGGGALPDIGVYPTVVTRFATGKEPKRIQASVEFDRKFKTDVYSSIRADFGSFELSFYLSTQLALRQFMVFHGDKGFIEVKAPFNADLYDQAHIQLYNQAHDGMQEFRYPGVNHYQLQVENFAEAAMGGSSPVFSLADSIKNQKAIDAMFRAGKHDGWEKV